MFTKTISLLILVFISLLQASWKTQETKYADVVIYGGTSAAITAAVQVVKMGKSVLIISPEKHLGGLSASGLGFTDSGEKSVIGGLSREFYQRIYSYYQNPAAWPWQERNEFGIAGQGHPADDGDKPTMWLFEPHVAENVFDDFIREYKITVYRNEYLDRISGVQKRNGIITSVKTLAGNTYKGKVFIDATYEGDLMAASGVSYHIGRESNSTYNEIWNGIQTGDLPVKFHSFKNLNVDPYVIPGDPKSGLLPLISTADPGVRGDGDKRIQAYCFRTCLTKNNQNRVPFTRPIDYESTQYELLIRAHNSGWAATFGGFAVVPNLKTDVNNKGPFSFDNIGKNYDYPEATYERRKEIIKQHESYQKGLLYFISHDSRMPPEIRGQMNEWGLSKDEFTDNGNWPYQLYIREARRMIGVSILTENEIMGKSKVLHPIAMGSYSMDSHNTQRYITPEGFVENEGDIEVKIPPYQVDLGSIIPKQSECKNLLVPVALSSSHIAYGSVRMEPVFMILGQSAATVAVLSMQNKTEPNELDYGVIKSRLIQDNQVLEYITH
jgi:FAD dependent oxidoreductase